MFSAAELLQALLARRKLRSIRPEAHSVGFPPSWAAWLASLGERVGAVTGATAESIVAIFEQRELASPPRRAIELNRWQAFAMLWRQQWQPPVREERWLRWSALVFSLIVHVFFAAMLLYLMYLRFMVVSQPEGEQVRVQLVGIGTPEEEGGGPPSPAPDPEPTPSAAAPDATAQPQRPQLTQEQAEASAVDAPTETQPEREVPSLVEIQPTPPAQQPLQVTESRTTQSTFRLPPPRERSVAVPQAQVAVPQLRTQIVEIPTPRPLAPVRPIQRDLPPREITVPQIAQQTTDIPTPRPLPAVRARALPERAAASPQLQSPSPSAEPRSLPIPAERPTAATATGATPAATATKPAGTPAATAEQARGTQPAATAAGPATSPKPGSAPTTTRADDWGDAKRNVAGQPTGGDKPGARPGLFNQDGSLRMPPGAASPGNAPPGSVEERIANLDRAGKWLERPGLPYKKSAFEKYWIPHETLLQEWVRKGIKKLSIPIPGTSKRLECVVSILQVGGGCGMTDSEKLFEQPAIARPPPDIPFKPELHEDQGALKK
ncbi:MAG: hypothetical protein LH470_04680 [Lysobacter sp.]|nr:hypothetical protein [Lysobacter sp.]